MHTQYIYIYIYIYTVMAKNIGTLGKYDQRRLWKWICIVNPFELLLKKSQKFNLSLDNKNLKWGEISLWNMFFSNTHWTQLTAPFYSIIFETFICQFNSSKFSPITPDDVIEHLTRDQRPFFHPESLHILQIHSSMTVLLLFSSPHSFSTGFRSEDWNGHSRSLVLCSVTHFCVVFEVCVWIIVRLEDPNMAHYKMSNRVGHF